MDLGPDREPHGGAPSRPMTLAEAVAHLTGTDPRFAVEEAEIRGERYRVFAHAPPHLRALLRDSRAAHGEGDYLVHEDERWSFDAFCADACRCAHMLTEELGVRPGDRVAIAMRNYPELLIAVMGIVSAGGVAVFLNAWWTADELAWALEDSDAKIVLADGPRLERIRRAAARLGVRPVAVRDAEGTGEEPAWSALMGATRDEAWPDAPIDPDDDFAVMYSSGTTGRPKGVVLTHRGAISAVFSWLMTTAAIPLMQEPPPEGTPPPPRPAMLITTPLFHVTATHPMFLLGLPMGARIVLMRKWDAEEAIRIIAREGVTRFLGVPTQSADLMDAVARTGADLPTLSYLGAGGAKRPAAQVGALAAAFPRAMVASGWGMTETNAVGLGVWGPDYLTHPEAAGRLYPPLQDLRIVGRDGAEVPLGEVGELTVRSPANMRGYLNQPEATAETLQGGWLRTGDLATVDATGLVTIVDRAKSIIIRGGENISCLDVEGALHRHPAVMEAGVFPVPDARLGETVGAGVRLREGAAVTAGELCDFLAERIARFKIPERIWLLGSDPLPRGSTDKIDRRVLRDRCLAEPERSGTAAPRARAEGAS